ncbi:MAG: DUF3253 domain-containing protein [Verrucomicrobiota bacterium]
MKEVEAEIERAILDLLSQRKTGATICPSEAARIVKPKSWRTLMEATRTVARSLVKAGEIEVCQKGAVVDAETAKGPIRLRLAAKSAESR